MAGFRLEEFWIKLVDMPDVTVTSFSNIWAFSNISKVLITETAQNTHTDMKINQGQDRCLK